MKTSTLIALCSSLASVIVAAEPSKPSQMHLIDREPLKVLQMHLIERNPIQTNAPPAYRVSVAYDLVPRGRGGYTPYVQSSEYLPSRP